jgi:putative flippase GtrA
VTLRTPEADQSSSGAGRRTEILGQAGRFLVVGIGTLVLDFATYRTLLALGLPVSLGKASGFVVGTASAYVLNRRVTFGHAGGGTAVLRFVLLYAVTLVLNVGVNEVVLRALAGVPGRITLAFLVAQAVTSVANFLGLRHVVFPTGGRR